MSEREYEALRSALASTRMEGFDVTEQTEKDCVRLMSGEVSVADLVKEFLARPAKAVWYAFSVSEYAIPAMQWACGSGLMQGDGVILTPKADATRAQAAALFQRFSENVAEK